MVYFCYLVDIYGIHVGKYTNLMDPMGNIGQISNTRKSKSDWPFFECLGLLLVAFLQLEIFHNMCIRWARDPVMTGVVTPISRVK